MMNRKLNGQEINGERKWKNMAIVLAGMIAVVIIGGGIVTVLDSVLGKRPVADTNIKKSHIEASVPAEKEMKLKSEITVTASGTESKSAETTEEKTDDYIIPESNVRLLTSADVEGFTAQELNYAKNEIYARHGRKFKSKELQDYFSEKSWYNGQYEPDDFDQNYSADALTDVEKQNAEFLKAKENER